MLLALATFPCRATGKGRTIASSSFIAEETNLQQRPAQIILEKRHEKGVVAEMVRCGLKNRLETEIDGRVGYNAYLKSNG